MASQDGPASTQGSRATTATSARADEPHTLPHELEALGVHAAASRKGFGFRIRSWLDVLQSFLAGRIITTMVVAAVLLTVLFLLIDAAV